MKKTYINPMIEVSLAEVEQIIAASITDIAGNSDLGLGDGEIPDEADVKGDDNLDTWGSDW